ncbi:MAG: ChaN family lipoprotein [Burkholderiaceae bacterium]
MPISAGVHTRTARRRLLATGLLPLLGGCAVANGPERRLPGAPGAAGLPGPGSPGAASSSNAWSSTASPSADSRPPESLTDEAWRADYLLLGEVHDNAEQHKLRLGWLDHLSSSRRFVLAVEQLDADRQADLDRALREAAAGDPAARARQVAEAAGFSFDGWHWPYYAPYFELALRRGLPLAAANLSRRDAMRIARGQAPAPAEPTGWGAAERSAMERSISDGHCGMLPANAVATMAAAQLARDRCLAQSVVSAGQRHGLPVVLLAGNGHMRRDIGVPRHLRELAPQARVLAIGLIERGDPGDAPFDRVATTAPQPRPDPCEAMRRRGASAPVSAPPPVSALPPVSAPAPDRR